MSTTKKVEAGSMLAVAALVLILIAAGFGRTSVSPRANAAWSQRMTQQAEQFQEQAQIKRAQDAWSTRLTGLAKREGKLPSEPTAAQLDRANAAWAARLTGLAEYLLSK